MSSETMDLLRISTCGSVDDGKSTLIGRLLYDSKSLFDDQLEALENASQLRGETEVNLANITDGLRAEREQGITIDVAYRYFATPKRKFIIADTPGHMQYTRNMVTGASTANLAVVLIDARKGVIEQTRRHSYIASLLGIPHLLVCVNKMDLVDYDEKRFNEIRNDYEAFSTRLDIKHITFLPVSALKGENVVDKSELMPWFKGPSFLAFLETVHIANDRNLSEARFPVQWVIRPRDDAHHDFRGFSGQIASGVFHKGDAVIVLPSGHRTKIKSLVCHDTNFETAFAPMSIAMTLEDEIDVSRGDMIVSANSIPYHCKEVDAMVCWMNPQPMQVNKKYTIKHTSRNVKAIIKKLNHRVDIETLDVDEEATELSMNQIGKVSFNLQSPINFDCYKKNRSLGAFIIIDDATMATVGAGMICEPSQDAPYPETTIEYLI
jgi:sulfate adenylyltransferase subunit 1